MTISFTPYSQSMKNTLKNAMKQGFTLTEMLIVILIIALLMAFIIPQLLKGPAAARDAVRVSRVNQIAAAIEQSRQSTGKYPTASDAVCLDGGQIGAGSDAVNISGLLPQDGLLDPSPDYAAKYLDGCKGYKYKSIKNEQTAVDNDAFIIFTALEADGKGNVPSTHASTKGEIKAGNGRIFARFSY